MKKILKIALSAAILCLTAVIVSVCVFAETEDLELKTVLAKMTNGMWGQSITYDKVTLDCSRITPDTEVRVEFELDGEWNGNGAPVELVFQNYSTADPAIWAKIPPYDYDETYAYFNYDSMVAAYGSDDFSTVDAVHLGDCGIGMKATKFVVTNCQKVEITTTTTAATTEAATEAVTEAAETTTAATTAATEAPSSSGSGQIPIVPIVIVTVVVAVIVVVIVIVLKNKKRFY
ncbi:MAG: hypothetical protein K2J11_06465 [Oscillospiraceae bacterium]|nr:hypothetical protein [Oscillospiraceae bacterium]